MKKHKINFKCIICGFEAEEIPLVCPNCDTKYPTIKYPDAEPLIDF